MVKIAAPLHAVADYPEQIIQSLKTCDAIPGFRSMRLCLDDNRPANALDIDLGFDFDDAEYTTSHTIRWQDATSQTGPVRIAPHDAATLACAALTALTSNWFSLVLTRHLPADARDGPIHLRIFSHCIIVSSEAYGSYINALDTQNSNDARSLAATLCTILAPRAPSRHAALRNVEQIQRAIAYWRFDPPDHTIERELDMIEFLVPEGAEIAALITS